MKKEQKKLQDTIDLENLEDIKDNLQVLLKLNEQVDEMTEKLEELTKGYINYTADILELRRLEGMIPLLQKGSPFLNTKKIDSFYALYFPLVFGEEIKGENVLAREIYQSKLLADNKKVIKWKESLSDTDKLLLELDE